MGEKQKERESEIVTKRKGERQRETARMCERTTKMERVKERQNWKD